MKIFVVLVIARLAFGTENDDDRPCTIKTDNGTYKGSIKYTQDLTEIFCFECIKYGVANFSQAPKAVCPNTTGDDVINPPTCPVCYQNSKFSRDQMSIDCLYLHVYVPQNCNNSSGKKELLPVLFYIHGGSFQTGCGPGPNDPHVCELLSKGCIVVTFNYRLDVFGFLSTGTCNCPGNAGFKDVVLALKWVNENIIKFGGDCSNIAVMGLSAGAALATQLLYLKEQLFKRLIFESGSSACDWAFISPEDAITTAVALGEKAGCSLLDSESLCDCLSRVDPMELLYFCKDLLLMDNMMKFKMIAMPLVVENASCSDCLITELPSISITKPPFFTPEIICGLTSLEFSIFRSMFDSYKDFIELLQLVINRSFSCFKSFSNPYCYDSITKQILAFYCPAGQKLNIDALIPLLSVTQFVLPILIHLQYLAKFGCPVYLYEFAFRGPCSAAAMAGSNSSTHGEMYPCLFPSNQTDACNAIFNDENTKRITNFLLDSYASFIKTGCPTADGIEWPRFDLQDASFLQIDKVIEKATCFQSEHMKFWSDLLNKKFLNERCSSCPADFLPPSSCTK